MSSADKPHYISSDTEDMVNSYDEEAPSIRPRLLCPKSMLRHVNTASLGAIADALQAEANTLRILSADGWQVDRRSTPDLITLWPSPESQWVVLEGAREKQPSSCMRQQATRMCSAATWPCVCSRRVVA